MSNEQFHVCTDGHIDLVQRDGERSMVIRGENYTFPGSVACDLEDTGNGFIARFPSKSSTKQDYYICLDYAQARDLVLGLSAFKRVLGFKEDTQSNRRKA